mmetsp:Transcript_26349/g.41168  ORF Transcript_26349/g.41168 Transcript_26349/m.41168 type:complete len:80 (+) Transcript_26349:2-241(+)
MHRGVPSTFFFQSAGVSMPPVTLQSGHSSMPPPITHQFGHNGTGTHQVGHSTMNCSMDMDDGGLCRSVSNHVDASMSMR